MSDIETKVIPFSSEVATAAQGAKADTAIQGVKLNNGTALTPDSGNIVNIPAAANGVIGVVSLSSSTTSSDENVAATALAVSQAYGLAQQAMRYSLESPAVDFDTYYPMGVVFVEDRTISHIPSSTVNVEEGEWVWFDYYGDVSSCSLSSPIWDSVHNVWITPSGVFGMQSGVAMTDNQTQTDAGLDCLDAKAAIYVDAEIKLGHIQINSNDEDIELTVDVVLSDRNNTTITVTGVPTNMYDAWWHYDQDVGDYVVEGTVIIDAAVFSGNGMCAIIESGCDVADLSFYDKFIVASPPPTGTTLHTGHVSGYMEAMREYVYHSDVEAIELPPAIIGKVRDLVIDIDVPANCPPIMIVGEGFNGELVEFVSDQSNALDLETGRNIISLTEIYQNEYDTGVFIVSRRVVSSLNTQSQ